MKNWFNQAKLQANSLVSEVENKVKGVEEQIKVSAAKTAVILKLVKLQGEKLNEVVNQTKEINIRVNNQAEEIAGFTKNQKAMEVKVDKGIAKMDQVLVILLNQGENKGS